MPDNPDFWTALGGSFSDTYKAKQEQRNKMQLILAELQAKNFYDPDAQAKQQAMSLVQRIGATPQPQGGYNSVEQQANIPQQVENNAGTNRLAMMQQYGLLPKATESLESIFNKAEARAAGAGAGAPPKELTPQQKGVEQNFRDLQSGLDRIDTMLASDKGFKQQLLVKDVWGAPLGSGGLKDEIANASDILLRMRSGAQINEQEYGRLSQMLPTSSDALSELFGNPGRARNKLTKFKNSVNEILSTSRARNSQQSGSTSFASLQEAEAAGLPSGTAITINGRRARVD